MDKRSAMYFSIPNVQPSGCAPVALHPQHHPVTSPLVFHGTLPHKARAISNTLASLQSGRASPELNAVQNRISGLPPPVPAGTRSRGRYGGADDP